MPADAGPCWSAILTRAMERASQPKLMSFVARIDYQTETTASSRCMYTVSHSAMPSVLPLYLLKKTFLASTWLLSSLTDSLFVAIWGLGEPYIASRRSFSK